MRPKFSEMLKALNSSHNVAEFCLQCPMYGIELTDKAIEEFTLDFIEDVVCNSIANESDSENAEQYNKLLYSSAQRYCLFIRETSMLDPAISITAIQHILNCFYTIYTTRQAKIATERECAQSRDAILALFFKSVETRRPGFLKTLKTADKRNILYLIADYSNIDNYLHLMNEYVDGKLLPKISIVDEDDDISYNILRLTFGHTIRSLMSCGVDPYEKADNGQSFADLILKENLSKLIQENYDGYIEAKEKDKAEK